MRKALEWWNRLPWYDRVLAFLAPATVILLALQHFWNWAQG